MLRCVLAGWLARVQALAERLSYVCSAQAIRHEDCVLAHGVFMTAVCEGVCPVAACDLSSMLLLT